MRGARQPHRQATLLAAIGLATVGGCLLAQQTDVFGESAEKTSLTSFLIRVGYRQLMFEEPIGGDFLPTPTRKKLARSNLPELQIARIYNARFLGMPVNENACDSVSDANARVVCDIARDRYRKPDSRLDELKVFIGSVQMLRADQAYAYLSKSGIPELVIRPKGSQSDYENILSDYFCKKEQEIATCKSILSRGYSVATYHGYVLQQNAGSDMAIRKEGILQMISSSYANSDQKNFKLAATLAIKDIGE